MEKDYTDFLRERNNIYILVISAADNLYDKDCLTILLTRFIAYPDWLWGVACFKFDSWQNQSLCTDHTFDLKCTVGLGSNFVLPLV